MPLGEACRKTCFSVQRVYLGLGRDRTREIQNFENQGTSMHGPSPAGTLAGLRRRHLCRQSPSRAIQRCPRTPTPFSGKLLCQSNLRLPSPFSSSSSWGRGQVSVRTSGSLWSAGGRGTGKEGGGRKVPGARVPRSQLAVPPSGAPPPSTGWASGKVCGGVRAGKASRMPRGGEGGGDVGCGH